MSDDRAGELPTLSTKDALTGRDRPEDVSERPYLPGDDCDVMALSVGLSLLLLPKE